MSAKLLIEWVSIAEFVVCVSILLLMARRRAFSEFPMLAAFVSTRGLYAGVTIPVLFFRKEIGISKIAAYNTYLASYWPSTILQAILMVLMVYGIYSLALAPFEPLKRLGTIIF